MIINSPRLFENVDNFFSANDDKHDYFVGSLGKDINNDQLSLHHLRLDYDNSKLSKYDINKQNIKITHTDSVVSDKETPLTAIKNSRNTSMWKCIQSQIEGESEISLSAGNTGVLLVISRMILKMMSEVAKPALAGLWPNQNGMNVVLDLGANIECNEENLIDFAELGSALYKSLFNDKPKVSLLNIGSEEIKGTESIKKAHTKLKEISKNGDFVFNGYIEGNKITDGITNVIVTDGFGGQDSEVVNVTINPVNDAPTVIDSAESTDEDTQVTISFNGDDVDGDDLTYTILEQTQNGLIVNNNDGTATYTPNAEFNGQDSFTYIANDGFLDSEEPPAVVTITVQSVNDNPVLDEIGDLDFFQTGTEKIEKVLSNEFKEVKVLRFDREALTEREIRESFLPESGEEMIIIGTQILAKGHHLPNITLVVVVDSDGGLFSIDFRASERLAQQITQVSGRAGRSKKKGKVILQSLVPEHPFLEKLANSDYQDISREILEERKLSSEPKTLEELSKKYKISRERIRQIETKAFEKLQKAMLNATQSKNLLPRN